MQSVTETKAVVEKSDDVKNSNVNEIKTAPAVVQNGVKTKDKVSLDETPKKPKAEVSKRVIIKKDFFFAVKFEKMKF